MATSKPQTFSRSWRHPADVRYIGWSALALTLLSATTFLTAGASIYAVLRRPERVLVVTKKTVRVGEDGKVIGEATELESVNNRRYGVLPQEGATLQTDDKPLDADRRYCVTQWVARFCTISQAVVERDETGKVRTLRQTELMRLMRVLVPKAAESFTAYLINSKILETEVKERWQATWETKSLVQDPSDPYLYRIVGKQTITKVVAGNPVMEERLLQFVVKVTNDPRGRVEENMMTGVQLVSLDFQSLTE